MAWAAVAAAVLSGIQTAQASKNASANAQNLRIAKEFEAAQLRQNAGQETAAAQRKALNERHRANIVASRAQAVAAASGAGASDVTIENIISDIAGEGEYRAGLAIYQGEENARRLSLGAESASLEGRIAQQQGEAKAKSLNLGIYGDVLTIGDSLYSNFGGGGVNNYSSILDDEDLMT